MSRFSDYIVYLDEYGDRGLDDLSADNGIFIQNFCIFDKRHYGETVIPQIQALKFRHFGHDGLFFSVDNARGPNQQQQFATEINEVIEHSNFVLISCIVDKGQVDQDKDDVFEQVLSFGLDHTHRFLQEREQTEQLTYLVAVGKDKATDQDFQENFRQICAGKNNKTLPFELHLTEQKHRPLGIQFTSLLSEPILAHYREPDRENPVFESLKTKFYCKGGRKKVGEGYEGWGLKFFN